MSSPSRPEVLSPHLGIYRWSWPMVMSIAHRASGMALAAGMVGLLFWLAALAGDGALISALSGFLAGFFGQALLFLIAWAFWHHLWGGVRHLLLDAGWFYDPLLASRLAAGQFFLAATLNLALWLSVWI